MHAFSRRLRHVTSLALVVTAGACGGSDAVTGPTTGSLAVTVAGLPGGANASVTVTGPSGFSRALTTTGTISDLPPGSYSVTATSVTVTDGRYEPSPASQAVAVVAGTTPATANVNYAIATGGLTVSIAGLPTGVNGAVTVTGPNQFNRTVTSTTTMSGLEPGSYSVVAADVATTDDGFAPSPPNQSVTIGAGAAPATASVQYLLATGKLSVTVAGLPAGFTAATTAAANAAVTVSGPGGYLRTVTASTVLVKLTPGVYTVSAANVVHAGFTYKPTQTSQPVTVAILTAPSAAAVSYAVSDGNMAVTVSGLPQGVSAAINVSGPNGYNQTVTGTTTLPTLTPGPYFLTASNVSSGGTTYSVAPSTQTVIVNVGGTATAAFGYISVVLRLAEVASGFERPVFLTAPAADPRLFVVEQWGVIRIVKNGQVLAQPFLDIRARVLSVDDFDDEHGLLGLAFHPQYATNGTFFVFYMDQSQDIVIERYQVSANPDVAIATGTLVLKVSHRVHKSHNGGGLVFGPDSFLYVSIGDGGCCSDLPGNAQNLNTLLGKVLRIDVSTSPYSIPASNPFVGQAGRMGEIWAYGLRNPWRIDVDAATSVLYIADVGEDAIEEVNAAPLTVAGANYGWNIMEGTQCFQVNCSSQGLRPPLLDYNHFEGCSVTGGFVYRGTQIPELLGQYFYSDYCAGFLRSFVYANGVATQRRDWNITPPGAVTSFGKDASGELYILTQAGTVFRIAKQ